MSFGDFDDDGGGSGGSDPFSQVLRIVADPWGVLRRRWIWMIAAAVVGLAGTAALVSTLEPSYLAQSRVLISSQQIPEDFVRSTVRESSLELINEMVSQILSQQNLSDMIRRHDLYPEKRSKTTLAGLVAGMRGMISISRERVVTAGEREVSQVFLVKYEYSEPNSAAAVANELAALFVEASLERRSRQARYTTEFLKRELERADRELNEIEGELTEYRRAHRGELPGDLAPALSRLERLQQQQQLLARQISDVEDRILVLSGAKRATAPPSELEELRSELTRLRGVYTDEHPNVIALKRRVAELEKDPFLAGSSSASSDSARQARIQEEERKLARLKGDRATALDEIKSIEQRIDRIPAREEELKAMERRASVLRGNYLEFLTKVQDAELAETLEAAQQGPRVSVLDRATPPGSPTQPPMLFLAGGIAASLALALGMAVLLEIVDPVVLTQDHLELLVGGRALGSLPRL